MDYLDSYKNLMMLQGYSDEMICKAFLATLTARSWFRKLSPRTIYLFGDLSMLFVVNFMSYRVKKKNASHLFTVHQKDVFNQVILELEDPSDKVVVMVIMEGLRLGLLFDSLSQSIPETLSAL